MQTELEQLNIETARRRRIDLYKSIIVWGFLAATLIPIVMSIVLLGQVATLEQKLKLLAGEVSDDIVTIQSSGEALMSNPNVNVDELLGEDSVNSDGTQISSDASGDGTLDISSYDTEEETKRVYLTFDDGPSIYTGQILDILAANDVKATFFVIAKDDERYLPYYKRILEEGHTLGMHSYTHDYKQVYASLESFEQDVTQLSDFLYEQTGVYPTIYRFPGGSSNSVSNVDMQECIAYLNEQGITYYDWNALNGDAVSEELTVEQLVNNIMGSVRQNNTSIVLMHDMQSRHTTVESLQLLIDTLKEEGYEILPIDEDTPLIQHIPYDSGFDDAAD